MISKSVDQSEMPQWLRGSEMGELMFIRDWTESGLGSIHAWPPHLQLVVNIVLLLPSAAILLWGPNLIQIYNDRFRDVMGCKHPRGLGQMVSECWPEAWNFVGPVCEGVMQRSESVTFDEQRLVLNRNGGPEEAFFRLTYSPVPDGMPGDAVYETGVPGGVLVTVTETTELVRARAREAEQIRLKEALQSKRIGLLEEIFRNAPSFLYVLQGPELVFEFANEAFYQLVGHRELIGRPAFAAIPEAAESGCKDKLIQVMATGEPFAGFQLPVTVARKPGEPPEERFIDGIYLPLFDEDGTCQRVLGHGIDVTAHVQMREQAEEALRASEERFRRALEVDTVGVIFFDKEGKFIEANDAFLQMSGLSREDGRAGLLRCDAETPPEWTEIFLRAADESEEKGRIIPYEQEFLRKDGSRWWASFTAKQLDEKEGVGYVTDITKRKHAEQGLRESEARFRALAEASPALTWQVDVRGNAVYLNQRYFDVVGKTFEELMAAGWRTVLHPEDAPAYMAAFEQALHNRSRFQHRVRIKTATGEWRWLKSYALPWFTAAGEEYAGHVGVSVDITDAVNAETALLEADRRKDEFLATLAHELRNPLAPITTALALMARPDGASAVPHLLPVISRQVSYMVRLVDDLLEISRITSGKVELRRTATDLNVLLRNAVEASLTLINENEHKLSVSLTEVPLIVDADGVRLEQVFTNLINNAARYTRKGGQIWLATRQEGPSAIVSVRDNGIGILPGMLPRLFDMFAQERRNGMGTQEGLGIGLNLVYRLVKMHGGTVEAMSEGRDLGSEFVVRLPLSEVPAREKNDEPGKTAGAAAAAPEGLRILVVDDNTDAAEVLRMLLESIGINAQAINSGAGALAAIPSYRPDVILMDIGMPGMNGHDVARRIREQPEFNNIKLVALTGWGQEEDRRQSKASGFDHHLTKPVNFKVLKDLLATM
ncbi:PAS domain-containing hybrid sensor histidine kinase/response regulator [Nitrosovibrio tenuis]|uniref:histidine kinase n=1 Tax=Nitrosovibrio tenuis TaxID=1233 RepID=A0A1H7IL42_9PROT|nr:PAS domain S-box protein [Nitrosovibrio tenuis]SEK63118.1 PAS domain S-box-containing protein [Nitrosovibrio tenuis]